MKDIITVEVNTKKLTKAEVIANFELETPADLLLIDRNVEGILNNPETEILLEEIIDILNDFCEEENYKLKNLEAYVTFINNDNSFCISIIIDKINIKKGRYRTRVMNWQDSGYIFKYADENANDCENM